VHLRQRASGTRISWRKGSWKNKGAQNFQMAGEIHFQIGSKNRVGKKQFL
jgi:hypothetical protein